MGYTCAKHKGVSFGVDKLIGGGNAEVDIVKFNGARKGDAVGTANDLCSLTTVADDLYGFFVFGKYIKLECARNNDLFFFGVGFVKQSKSRLYGGKRLFCRKAVVCVFARCGVYINDAGVFGDLFVFCVFFICLFVACFIILNILDIFLSHLGFAACGVSFFVGAGSKNACCNKKRTKEQRDQPKAKSFFHFHISSIHFLPFAEKFLPLNYSIFAQNVNKNSSQKTGLCKIYRKDNKKISRNTKVSADKCFVYNQFSKAA